jgi:hypothetical protein
MTTMADLGDGVRIRHLAWDMTGTIRVVGRVSAITWDNKFGDMEISNEGVVFPRDVEIIGKAA